MVAAWSISQKKFVDCTAEYAKAMEDVAIDLRKFGADKAKIKKYMDDHNADFILKNNDGTMDTAKLNELKKKVLTSEAPAKIKLAAVKALEAKCGAKNNAGDQDWDEEEIKRWEGIVDRKIEEVRSRVKKLDEEMRYANSLDIEDLDILKRFAADLENAKKDLDKLILVFR